MPGFEPMDPQFETRIRRSFARQTLMVTIGAALTRVSPGDVQIELPVRSDLSQQHGYVHGGIVTAIVDSACGYAALSLAPAGTEVLTVEYKVNFLAPARGARLVARGRVMRPGRTISVCSGDVVAVDGAHTTLIVTMLTTMIARQEPRAPDPVE
jgi:uncharacterized protein (TIGR00369 family)